MILDSLENCSAYTGLNSRFEKAFAFLSRPDLKELPPGAYAIDGDAIFARIVNESGVTDKTGPLELHQKYIDIQYVVAGTDGMAWKPKAQCQQPVADYNPTTDAQHFHDAPATWFDVSAHSFALFFPEDAHKAMISEGVIHKVIIKVAV